MRYVFWSGSRSVALYCGDEIVIVLKWDELAKYRFGTVPPTR